MINHVLTFLALFALGPLVELGIKQWGRRSALAFPWSGTALGLVLAIVGSLIRAGSDATSRSNGDGAQFAMSLLGLVISVVTGLTVAAAWRAIDDARHAAEIAEKSATVVDQRLREVEFQTRRVAAYTEALERLRRLGERTECRNQRILRAEVVSLFKRDTVDELAATAEDLVSNEDIGREIGPEGFRYIEFLLSRFEFSKPARRALYQLLSEAER